MAVLIANLSGVVTGAVQAAMGLAAEMLPTDVTRPDWDTVLETATAWIAWFLHQLWTWLVAARAGAAEKLKVATAGSAASEPWLGIASKLVDGIFGRLVTAIAVSIGNLPDADDMSKRGTTGYALLLVLALLPVVFLCRAVWALTCRTMKGPGLDGRRVPRAMFEANPRRYYSAVRTARKARRTASGAGWKLLVVGAIFAYAAYVAAKTNY